MQSLFISVLIVGAFALSAQCQTENSRNNMSEKSQYLSMQFGLTLLEAPAIFYPNVGVAYSKTFWRRGQHQLAFKPQFQFITVPKIESKYLISANAAYTFQSRKHFECSVYAGINYQLRIFSYFISEYKEGELKKIGRTRHQTGPIIGAQFGYRLFRKKTYPITPFLGVTLIKVRNSYTRTFHEGFVPTLYIGSKILFN